MFKFFCFIWNETKIWKCSIVWHFLTTVMWFFIPVFLLVQGSTPSSLAAEIAKARQHIKNSLECVSTLIIFMHIVLQFITYANIDFEVGTVRVFLGVLGLWFFYKDNFNWYVHMLIYIKYLDLQSFMQIRCHFQYNF